MRHNTPADDGAAPIHATGAWGSEPVPAGLAAGEAQAAADLFGDIMAGASSFSAGTGRPAVTAAHRIDDAVAAMLEARARRCHLFVPDRAPDCTTSRAATIAGILSHAVMTGEITMTGPLKFEVVQRLPFIGDAAGGRDYDEGVRIAQMMLEARARASVRTPGHAALSGAEAALALAEDALDAATHDMIIDAAGEGFLASIRDVLRAGLRPLHAAETAGQAPYDAGPPRVVPPPAAGPTGA